MTTASPSALLMHLANGFRVSQAIHVAAALGVADLLREGPLSSDTLAAATKSHPGALYRLLRALAAVGIFHEDNDKRFSLTPLGQCLRSDAPHPVGPYAEFIGRPHVWQAWGHLLHSVQTGENAFHNVHEVSMWDYHKEHPNEGAIFASALTGNSRGIAEEVISAYDFSRFDCVVDVGGGEGRLLAGLLAAYPNMRGILFDQVQVVAGAAPVLASVGVADRCEAVGGNFFDTVPAGADAYLLRYILHDWDDAASIAILRSCRRVCKRNGRLLVLERLVEPPNEGLETKTSDLNMLVSLGGQERTQAEFAELLAAAGFRLETVAAVNSRLWVIEGVPS
jgi:ubiquinone/menaquinone biosynthesis C-methylase UbiE